MKKYILISFFILTLFSFAVYFLKDNYSLRISLIFQNKSAADIDSVWAFNLNREFANIKGVKDVLTVSSYNQCNVYVKFNPFLFDNTKQLNKIKLKFDTLFNNLNFYDERIIIDFDFDCNKKYNYFLVFSFLNDDFENFFDFENKFLNYFSYDFATSKISIFPLRPFVTKIYFDYDALEKFRLDIAKIQKIITENNNNYNFFNKATLSGVYGANISSDIDNINDIKNLTVPFLDKSFSMKLGDVFEVENGLKFLEDSKIVYKNNDSLIFAISKKWFYPAFLYELKIKKYLEDASPSIENFANCQLINTNLLTKVSLKVNKEDNLEEIQNKISSKIQNDKSLYFLRIDNPKISKEEIFCQTDNEKFIILVDKKQKRELNKILSQLNIEAERKKIIVSSKSLQALSQKIDDLLKIHKNASSFLTKKDAVILYKIDNYFLNDYQISKTEVINSLIAKNDGLILDYYLNSCHKIPILLKNKDDKLDAFVYSPSKKTLYNINSFLNNELKAGYTQIARKNAKFFAIIKF